MDQAARRLNDKLGKIQVNDAQAFAERKQTVDLFATTARRLTLSFTSLRKGRVSECFSHLGISLSSKSAGWHNRFKKRYTKDPFNASAQAWLELQYGWKPLLQDVYGAAEKLASIPFEPMVNTVRSQGACERTDVSDLSIDGGYDVCYSSVSARAGYTLTYTVSNPVLREASSVGLTNPALLAWELLPYSFVVDWFLPIGTYLEHVNSSFGLEFLRGSRFTKSIVTASGSRSQSYSNGLYSGSYSQVYSTIRRMIFSRSVLGDFPREPLPEFKNPVSTTHVLNAISLLALAFRR
jgi:hypothetical protein